MIKKWNIIQTKYRYNHLSTIQLLHENNNTMQVLKVVIIYSKLLPPPSNKQTKIIKYWGKPLLSDRLDNTSKHKTCLKRVLIVEFFRT